MEESIMELKIVQEPEEKKGACLQVRLKSNGDDVLMQVRFEGKRTWWSVCSLQPEGSLELHTSIGDSRLLLDEYGQIVVRKR
jgi:hypothetical protein